MKEEFAPVLPELVPHLIDVIGTDEGQLEPAEEQENVSVGVAIFCRTLVFFFLFSLPCP